jgi:hypothetical protein
MTGRRRLCRDDLHGRPVRVSSQEVHGNTICRFPEVRSRGERLDSAAKRGLRRREELRYGLGALPPNPRHLSL